MNKIEKSIIDSLNGVTCRNGNWKLFASRKVSSNMKLNDKEIKVYNALCEFLSDKDTTISVLPTSKFTTMLVDWTNEKLIENLSTLVDIKTLEKCLKFYFLNNHLSLNRYFCLSVNNTDDKLYIVSVCRESGIYQIKENVTTDSDTVESDTTENNDLQKIAKYLNDIARLAKDFSNTDKIEVIKNLEKLLNVNATVSVIKAIKQA